MQTGEQRDEKTVLIATALGLFCLVIAVGGLPEHSTAPW